MRKTYFVLLFVLSSIAALSAQTAEDALRYSFLTPSGPARFAGTAGAMTPLGVDFSTFSVNPAAIGWARGGYFVFTPAFKIEGSNTQLLNGSNNPSLEETKGRFNIPNLGAVFSNETRSLYWPVFNVGIGINRMADFNETITFSGNSAGSIVESFVEDANDNVFNEFRNILGIDAEALFFNEDGFYDSDFSNNPSGVINREGTITRTGGISEFAVTIGGNYRDKFMWGLGLGVPFMTFEETRNYQEVDRDNQVPAFDDLSFDELLEVSGSGLNFKLGAIYRASQALRVSLAIHTPTFWSIDEVYETDFSYAYTDVDGIAQGGTALSPRGEFTYNLQTPWRFNFGVGSVIARKGFLALDVDYVNYDANAFSFDDFTVEATQANEDIDFLLRSAVAARLGGEFNLDPLLLRAGVGIQTSPVDGADETDVLLSLGLGYRKNKFFADLAYQHLSRSRLLQPYSTFSIEPQLVDLNFTRHNLLLSAGIYF